jgi:transposase-like protein
MQRSKYTAEFKAEAVKQLVDKGHQKQTLACDKAMYLTTAGGQIKCLRCTARSSRTKQQCAKPALKVSSTQKCQVHGGRPHTTETLQRISEANTIHGECTKVAKEQYRQDAVLIRQLEDAVRVLKMAEGPRLRGRKPEGYESLQTVDDVVRLITERALHRVITLS